MQVVRQIQLRQQAATVAAAAVQQQQQHQQQQAHVQAAAAQVKAEQQAQVLAAAAEVAQQVAARNAAAAAAAEQQRQTQQQQARVAAEQRLLAAAAPGAAGDSGAAAASAAAASHSALYKRTSAATDAASVLYKRPALGDAGGGAAAAAAAPGRAEAAAAAAQQQQAAQRAPVSALYGNFCADRHAASSASSAVASEMMQRLGGHNAAAAVVVPAGRATVADAAATAQSAKSAQSTHTMAVSPAPEAATPGESSHCSETAFLDCHEELSDDAGGGADGAYGSVCAIDPSTSASGDSGCSVSLAVGAVNSFTKPPVVAAAAKPLARPARPYGPVYCPVIYSDVSSPRALALANDIMAGISLPGGIRYMPVSTESMLYYNGVHWGFSAFALALGSSYFQRLVEITPTLNAAVRHAPPFAAYAAYMSDGGAVSPAAKQQQQQEYLHKDGLRSILFTCAYLATKVVDRMPHTDMLRRMLSMLYNVPVSREEAHSVELKCLEGLGYRLGPYFLHNRLEDERPPCCDEY